MRVPYVSVARHLSASTTVSLVLLIPRLVSLSDICRICQDELVAQQHPVLKERGKDQQEEFNEGGGFRGGH